MDEIKKKAVTSFSGTIPCLIQIVGLFFVPESPRWLVISFTIFLNFVEVKCARIALDEIQCSSVQAKVGKWDGSEASLLRLRGKDADIFEEAAEIRVGV